MKGVRLVVGVMAAALLGACSSEAPTESGGDGAVVPSGFEQVTAAAAQVSFAAPEGWAEISSPDLDGEAAEALADLAEAVQMPAEDLHANAQEVDLFLVEPEAKDPADPQNIVVNHEPAEAIEGLPTEQEVQALFEAYGMQSTGYGERSAPVGETAYGLSESPAEGPSAHMGMAFALNEEGELVVISISFPEADGLESVTQTVAETIAAG